MFLYSPILCFYTDVDCFSCEQTGVGLCRTLGLNAFQTRECSIFTVKALKFFPSE